MSDKALNGYNDNGIVVLEEKRKHPLIDKVFAAPKHLNDESLGVAFSVENEIGYEIPSFSTAEKLIHHKKHLKTYQKNYEAIEGWLSVQGPSADVNPLSEDSEIALVSLHRYTQTIEVCKAMGAQYVIFNSPYHPVQDVSGGYNHWLSASVDFWQKLIEEQLRSTRIILLISNVMEKSPAPLTELIARIDSPRLKSCIDVGYVNVFSKIPALDWLDAMGSDVEYVRVSNNDGKINAHQSFLDGTIDMSAFINHMALLPQRLHLSMDVHDLKGLKESYELIKPFIKMQQEQMVTKSLII